MSNQLIKNTALGTLRVYPKTYTEGITDKSTGKKLAEILSNFNMYFLSYTGNTAQTRCQVPKDLRREGLWITYVDFNHKVITEWYNSDNIDNETWGVDTYWRQGSNKLIGDISISVNGNWVINGNETEFKATGDPIKPLLRVNFSTNKLQVSYDDGNKYEDLGNNPIYTTFRTANNKLLVSTDLGKTWTDTSEYIAAWFRWTDADSNGNLGKILISRDNTTWLDMTPNFVNNLYIKGYVATVGELPTSTAALGDIYMVGPTYDESDTTHDYPHYRMLVKLSSGWVDNGEYLSNVLISLTTGLETGITMSLKAITDSIAKQGIYDVSANNGGAVFESLSALLNNANLSTLIPASVRCGGMSIRFIQGSVPNSDNKYVQYMLMNQNWSTVVTDWQGVDNEPTAGSDNLVKSSGIYNNYTKRSKDTMRFALSKGINPIAFYTNNPALEAIFPDCYILSDGRIVESNHWCVVAIRLFSGKTYKIKWNSASTLDVIYSYAASIYTRSITLEDATLLLSNANGEAPTEYTPSEDLIVFVNNTGYNQVNRLFTQIEGFCYTYDFIKNDVINCIQFYTDYFVNNNKIYKLAGCKFSEFIEPLTDLIITDFYSSEGVSVVSYYDKNYHFISAENPNCSSFTVHKNKLAEIGAKFIVICLQNNHKNCKIYGYIQKPDVDNLVYQGSFKPIGKVAGYTRRATHSLEQQTGFYSNIYNVEGVPFIQVTQNMYTDWALFTILFVYQFDTSNPDSINNNIIGYADSSQDAVSFVKVPPCAKYAVVAIHDSYKISPAIHKHVVIDKFYGKTCLYIGDSISTRNNYKWMGYIEEQFGIKYVRADSNKHLAPAEGGIGLIPDNPEPELDVNKSIWYRCAQQRMSYYDFDIVSIFGGTNNFNNPNVGTVDDIAYVDTLNGFDSSILNRLTADRPDTLTFAASLKGCIEMIHRDFPLVTIIIPTVMPLSDPEYIEMPEDTESERSIKNYVALSQSLDETKLPRSERFAKVAMKIVDYYQKLNYDIIAVPLYWGKKNPKNADAFADAIDGVHPNIAGAKDMTRIFAEALLLNNK